jgi:autotransporter-associated beta strand protein
MAGGFSRKLVTSLGVALVALASAVPANADVWLDETFSDYIVAAPPTAPNTTLSPLLLTPVAYSTVVSVNSTNMGKYAKAAVTTTGSLQYGLSAGLTADGSGGITRPQGYLSFKILQNTSSVGTIATNSYLNFRLGAKDTNGLSSAAASFIDVRFLQAATANFKVNTGSNSTLTISPTAVNIVKIWYNGTSSAWSYPDPTSGASTLLNANTFVVFVNNVLGVASANGITLATSVTTTGTTLSSNIGKIAFLSSSSNGADFSVDDIYAADAAPVLTTPPVITSATTVTGYQNIAFSYQITADQPALTSFALASGTLPTGLTLDTVTGLISGTPSATGTSNVTLTATNANGTSAAAPLAITVIVPLNTFSGSNVSLNTSASWSLGAAPNSSLSIGSYQDVALASSVTALTTSSGSLFAKSWNVSNGSSYTLTSVKPDGATTFKMGITSPVVTTFTNTVSGITNDLVYLTGNSNITFSPLNSINALTPSTVELNNSGNLNIGAGSTLNIDAVTTGSYALTKTSAGTVGLSAANTYNGGTTLTAGTMNVSGSAAPTRLAQVKADVTGGVVTGYTVVDGGAGYTAVPTVTVSKNTGEGTVVEAKAVATISGGAVTAVNINVTAGSGYTLAPKVQIYSNQSPLGSGAVTLASGALNASVDTDLSRMTFFPDATNTFFRINGTPLIINGSVSLDVAADKTLSAHALTGNGGANLVTKTGVGTLWLRGGGATNVVGGWSVNAGTLFVGTTASSGTGTGLVTMNGGNLRFSKGLSSSGSYTGQGQDAGLVVNQDTTITLDANPATPSGSNTVSYGTNDSASGSVLTTGLTIGTKTINLVKSAAAKSSADELGYSDPLMTFYSANLSGTATLNVGALSQMSLQNAVGTGGVTKTGTGRLSISERNVYDGAVPPVFVATLPNTYTGATAINAGTAAFSGTQASSITIANGAFLESSVGATPSTTGSLTLAAGSAVTIVGTPTLASYTLFTAAGGITGTPVLAVAVAGYDLVKDGNSLKLNAVSSGSYSTWAAANGITGEPASGDFENDGISNLVEYALGTDPTVSTQPAGVLAGNVITFTKGADAIANGDVSWVIETSETLENGSWTAQVTQAAGDATATISYTLTPGSPAKNFARLKATQN